jgi:hypothetical protein
MRVRVGSDENTGPNDARCVVWAISTSFFFFVFLYILINVSYFKFNTPLTNKPYSRRVALFGPRYFFFSFIFKFC